MKRIVLFLVFTLLFCIDCFSQRQPPYFHRNSYFFNKCDFIVKGELIDKKTVAYLGDEIIDSIVAVKIQITDDFGYDIEDSVWVYPDIENYYNKQKRIDTSNRDSVWFLQFEDVNYESCFHINFDNEYNGFEIGASGYYRFWIENGTYVYSLIDRDFPLVIRHDKMFVDINRLQQFINRHIPLDRFYYVKEKRFEKKLNKRIKKNLHI